MRLIKAEPLIEFLEQKRIEWFDLDIGASSAYDIAKRAVEGAPTVDAVSWKDFRDFLDDNAEDFESINKRLDALERKLDFLMQVEDHEHEAIDERLNAIEAIPIKSNVPVMFNGTWYNPNVLKGNHYTASNKTKEQNKRMEARDV